METLRYANTQLRALLGLQVEEGKQLLQNENEVIENYELTVKQYITLDLRRLQLQHALYETQVSIFICEVSLIYRYTKEL